MSIFLELTSYSVITTERLSCYWKFNNIRSDYSICYKLKSYSPVHPLSLSTGRRVLNGTLCWGIESLFNLVRLVHSVWYLFGQKKPHSMCKSQLVNGGKFVVLGQRGEPGFYVFVTNFLNRLWSQQFVWMPLVCCGNPTEYSATICWVHFFMYI